MNYLTMRRPNGGLRVFDDFDRIVDSVFSTAGELGAGRPAVDIRSTPAGTRSRPICPASTSNGSTFASRTIFW